MKTKIWLIIATSFVLIGCVAFVGVMTMLGWDFTKLSTVKYETNTHEIAEAFQRISIQTDTSDIVFALSEDGKCRVVCYEKEKRKHTVSVQGDTLSIRAQKRRSWKDYIGFNFKTPKITVYLPQAEYQSLLIDGSTGDIEMPNTFQFKNADISVNTGSVRFFASASERIKIKTDTGDICVENVQAGALDLSVSTGDVKALGIRCDGTMTVGVSTGDANLDDIVCKNFTSSGNTGDISLYHVIAEEKFSIERSTGDIFFDGCDAGEIFAKTDTGNITGSLLTSKVFIVEASTGRCRVPKTVTGGRCEIYTDTGDIQITVVGS